MRVLAMAMGAAGVLPGCVAWQIRDEVRAANAQLVEVQDTIVRTNERLEQTNTLIGSVEQGLGRIDSTNTSLAALEQQLALLNSINTSLAQLDLHMASLRRTIGRFDSVIPFLDLGGDAPLDVSPTTPTPPPPSAQAGGAGAGAAQAGDAPAGQEAAGETPARRDPLLGVWVRVYPDADEAYVLEANGTFVHSIAGYGTWRRDGMRLEFTFPATTTKRADGTAEERPEQVWTMEVLHVTGRSLAVRSGPLLRVYARP
jgi:hypothetical protein